MQEVYIKIFWWIAVIVGTCISGLVIVAATSVIKASKQVVEHGVKIDNIQTNLVAYRKDVIDTNGKIIDTFSSEIEPIKTDVKELKDKQQKHSEKIVQIQTHLRLSNG